MGGELDSRIVNINPKSSDSDMAITRALIGMLQGQIVTAGDTIEIRELGS
jgi:hypothetical protein